MDVKTPERKRIDNLLLKDRVIEVLRTVYDPEIPINIYDLGLIYDLNVDAELGDVDVYMTLTTPGCPLVQSFPSTVESVVKEVSGVNNVNVELVWDPPWTIDRISEEGRKLLSITEH